MNDEFMTVKELSEILRVSQPTILELIKRGDIKAFRLSVGGSWRIKRSDFEAYLNQATSTSK